MHTRFMAEKIEELPMIANGGGRPAKYPWAEWLDGSAWKLTRGVDFEPTVATMRQRVLAQAQAQHLKATTRTNGDTLYLQVIGRT